jgi:hypothetical protein
MQHDAKKIMEKVLNASTKGKIREDMNKTKPGLPDLRRVFIVQTRGLAI